MGKKNNHNKKQSASQKTQNMAKVAAPNEEQIQNADELQRELQQECEENKVDVVESLPQKDQEEFDRAKEKNAVDDYWRKLLGIRSQLQSLQKKIEDEQSKWNEKKQTEETALQSDRESVDEAKNKMKDKLYVLNKREKNVLERELALDNGEYTEVINHLMGTLRESGEKVFTDTEAYLTKLNELHQKNLEDIFSKVDEASELKKQQMELEREQKKFEAGKELFEEDLREKYEEKYEGVLEQTRRSLEMEQSKNKRLVQTNDNLQGKIEAIQAAFMDVELDQMLPEYRAMKDRLEKLENELNERPEQREVDQLQEEKQILQQKVQELKNQVDEKEIMQLKALLHNNDSYIIELESYKNKIESAEAREASLRRTIDDLHVTIDQLKGERDKTGEAFETANKMDNDAAMQNKKIEGNAPDDLTKLVQFVQMKMAGKNFYYDERTIRTFIAGLYMSPITILQGISGTGKTSLPREFAKALTDISEFQGKNGAPYRICAVQSGWRDNMDLMGYYNSFDHKYNETDFFQALYAANQPKYKDTLFLIILDEMNLSRPEHYFADFLSLLEQSEQERYIRINAPLDTLPRLVNKDDGTGKLRVPKNVRFIGTANHDETTLEFAPKTYDRSNLMEMPKNYAKVGNGKINDYVVTYPWLEKKFKDSSNAHKGEFTTFKYFIDNAELKDMLAAKGIGIGNRFENQAERFICAYRACGGKLAEAADHLVTSRLFRTLKNRYDLDKGSLTAFKEKYKKLFKNGFDKEEPQIALGFLDEEIQKKEK